MGASTFSGPLQAGTVREGAAANVGRASLSQSVAIAANAANAVTGRIVVPAGSTILSIIVDITTAFNGSTAPFTIGTAAAGSQYGSGVATTAGRITPTYTGANALAMGSTAADASDDRISTLYVTVSPTGSNTTGALLATVVYRQN